MPSSFQQTDAVAYTSVPSTGFIFVTGGAGLVGGALLKQLLQQSQLPIKALYHQHLPVVLSAEEQARVQWIQGNVLDTSLLYQELQGCTQVYHTAAIVSYHSSRRKQMYQINIDGTANMVNACLANGVHKLVHVSSVAALGRIRMDEAVTEETKWTEENNNSHYGKTKYLSELEVWRGIGEGLNAVIVNPSIILGEASWHTGSTALFKNAYNEFPWYTKGGTGFVDAQDVAAAMIQLMEHPVSAERFLLSHAHLSFQEALTRIAVAFGKKPPQRYAKPWMSEIVWRIESIKSMFSNTEPLLTKETAAAAHATTRYSTTKLKSVLPHFEFTPIDVTIARTCQWLRQYYQL